MSGGIRGSLGNGEGGDELFFAERARLRPRGLRRSLRRATTLAGLLGIDRDELRGGPPVLTVVGSKGKGTAAVHGSAVLAAAGLRVGTLTSPGLRSNRERIRIDGAAIEPAAYTRLIATVGDAMQRDGLPDDGYLSPTGLFTLAAMRHFLDTSCDACVLEAGMGGRSDEVSLFSPRVVAVTSVFAEHLGVLGDTVTDIARDKLGVVTADTVAVVSVEQEHPQARAVLDTFGDRVRIVPTTDSLIAGNGLAGRVAALALIAAMRIAPLEPECIASVGKTIRLPGRQSVHPTPERTWVADAAVTATGAAAAIQFAVRQIGGVDTVLVCLPDGKDVTGVLNALRGHHVIPLRSDAPHLSFDTWPTALPSLAELDSSVFGQRVLALGTVSFIGEVLDLLDVDTETAFDAQSARTFQHSRAGTSRS